MSAEEAAEFERNPHHAEGVKLRLYDDMGKVPEMRTPGLEDFRAILEAAVACELLLLGIRRCNRESNWWSSTGRAR